VLAGKAGPGAVVAVAGKLGATAGVADLFHSIHSKVATTSQAISKNERV
jgi:hypothetical protein